MSIKYSYGVMLFKTNPMEILLVQRRYTYDFFDFVFGKYSDVESAKKLFNGMVPEELIMIKQMDFDILWHKLWINPAGILNQYERCSAKFHDMFIKPDHGKNLQRYIDYSMPCGELLWEIPKGHKNTHKESNIYCAVRELFEETGYDKTSYTIIPGLTKIIRYTHNGFNYEITYYVGKLKPGIVENKRFNLIKSSEVNGQHWTPMDMLPHMNKSKFLLDPVNFGKKKLKKYMKGIYENYVQPLPP